MQGFCELRRGRKLHEKRGKAKDFTLKYKENRGFLFFSWTKMVQKSCFYFLAPDQKEK